MNRTSKSAPTRPILRYFGGKWRIAKWVIANFPPHRVYCEPFAGAASVLLQKTRSYAEILNDMDGRIVNLFKIVRDRGDELARAIELTPFARAEYYAAHNPSPDPFENARQTVILSFMGHGSDSLRPRRKSGFRAKSYSNRVPAAHDWRNYPGCLPAIVERLRGVQIESMDALDCFTKFDGPDRLFYCDPPYPLSTRSLNAHDRGGYQCEMTDEQHAAFLTAARAVQGFCIISGYDCPLYRDLLGDWRSVSTNAYADHAANRVETLWLSPNCPDTDMFHGHFQEPTAIPVD